MKVSYAITVKDELPELTSLCNRLDRWLQGVSYDAEIVILKDDCAILDPALFANILRFLSDVLNVPGYRVVYRAFDNDFSAHKNFLNSQCKGDYIFQIDADEYPSTVLVQFLGALLIQNPETDLFWIPRVNTVEGLTPQHIAMWGWKMLKMEGIDLPTINWPDPQSRIYRNDPKIHWVNKVHEHIEGAEKYTRLPAEVTWALYHPKTITKQEQQNAKYATMER